MLELYFIIGAIFFVIYLSLIIISDIVYENKKVFPVIHIFASVFVGLIWVAFVFVAVLFFIGWLIFKIVETIKNKKGKKDEVQEI